MKHKRLLIPVSAAFFALTVAAAAHGQSLGERTRGDGTYRFSFPAKPGVCGDGAATIYINDDGGRHQRIQIRGDNWNMSTSRFIDEWSSLCEEGPARIALTVEGGRVASLRTYVGGTWRSSTDARDLGSITPAAAVDYLLDVAQKSGNKVGRDALFAATLADNPQTFRRLLTIAKDQNVPRETRRNAVFWLSQDAADAATVGLKEIIESDEDLDVREHAVFALSQRPAEESVPALIALVKKKNTDPRITKKALFWLAQKDDPRVIALFEEILNK